MTRRYRVRVARSHPLGLVLAVFAAFVALNTLAWVL